MEFLLFSIKGFHVLLISWHNEKAAVGILGVPYIQRDTRHPGGQSIKASAQSKACLQEATVVALFKMQGVIGQWCSFPGRIKMGICQQRSNIEHEFIQFNWHIGPQCHFNISWLCYDQPNPCKTTMQVKHGRVAFAILFYYKIQNSYFLLANELLPYLFLKLDIMMEKNSKTREEKQIRKTPVLFP